MHRILIFLVFATSAIIGCVGSTAEDQNPFEEGLLKINGADLFLKVEGTGPPMIIIHGGPGLGYHYLLPHLQELTEFNQIIYFDQRASGKSGYDLDSTEVNLAAFIDDIDGIRKHFGFDKVNILAHSFGGVIALNYAVTYPEKLGKLILINSLAPDATINSAANTRLANRFTAADIEERTNIMRTEAFRTGDPAAFESLMMIGFNYQFHQTDKANELQLGLPRDFAQKSAVLQWLAPDLVKYEWKDRLKRLQNEVLLLYGQHDPLYDLALPFLEDQLPQNRKIVMEESGHFPFIEQNEQTMDAIVEFVASSSQH